MADKKHTSKNRGGYDKKFYHGSIYKTWSCMKTRCLNKTDSNYHRYGLRGIKISDKWLDFKGFLEDMGDSYIKGLTLDRIDNNGNYCKENCRWATKKEQALNTRNVERVKRYEINGIKYTIREMSEMFSIKRSTLDMILNHYKWSLDKALIK